MTGPVVILEDIDKIFGEGASNQVHALKEINLNVEKNEFISLIGPSGCGKSTLLRVVGDLIEPSAGVATVNSKSARQAGSIRITVSFFRQRHCMTGAQSPKMCSFPWS